MARTANTKADRRRWLCSHLVDLEFEAGRFPARAGILEEIELQGAGLGVECPYPVGTRLKIKAGEFQIPAEVILRIPRETDFLLWARFVDGHLWSPLSWRPDHLYLLPETRKKLRRAAGQGR